MYGHRVEDGGQETVQGPSAGGEGAASSADQRLAGESERVCAPHLRTGGGPGPPTPAEAASAAPEAASAAPAEAASAAPEAASAAPGWESPAPEAAWREPRVGIDGWDQHGGNLGLGSRRH